MTKAKTAAEKKAEGAQARADKAAAKKAKQGEPSGTQIELPKGVGTQDDVPPPSNPEPLERGAGEHDPKTREEDTLRLPEDKAVWAFGTGEDVSPKALMDDQRAITQASAEK